MPNLVQIIKKIAVEAVEAGKPMQILFGVYQADGSIKVDQKLIYTDAFLVWRDGLKKESLTAGDSLILLSFPGGQRFLVLDKVVT